MKIWIQSATGMGADPIWKDYEESVKKNAKRVARPDTEITWSGVKIMTPALERHYYFQLLTKPQMIENAIAAEKKGYDIVCVSCMLDLGRDEIRELLQIPSVYNGESAFLMACTLGQKFSLISQNPNLLEMMNRNVAKYGLERRATAPQSLDTTLEDLAESFKDPKKVARISEAFRKAARKAAEAGAEVLVPACNVLNMFCVENGIKEVEGITVLDSLSVMVKTAEMMVDLKKEIGLSVSRRYSFCRPDKEILRAVRKSHNLA